MPPPPPNDDDAELLGRLYDAHGATLYRYALMLLAHPAAAEDAVQDAFLGLLNGRTRPDDAGPFLRVSVRNACYSRLRRHRRWHGLEQPLLEAVAPGPGIADERLTLERALRALPPEQREVVHLHVFEGWTFREIAEGIDVSLNTAASRYRYALAKLREVLS